PNRCDKECAIFLPPQKPTDRTSVIYRSRSGPSGLFSLPGNARFGPLHRDWNRPILRACFFPPGTEGKERSPFALSAAHYCCRSCVHAVVLFSVSLSTFVPVVTPFLVASNKHG
ncbi:unnamed protein product, partial [Ectocarpus sp. 8 AP-2014]